MAENKQNNKTYISGEIASESVFSHESYGEKFYECKVRIARLSGTHDTLPVVISEHIMPKDWAEGKTVHALGQFRSYNKIIDGKSRLQQIRLHTCHSVGAKRSLCERFIDRRQGADTRTNSEP